MADILSSASTVLNRAVYGNEREVVQEFTTASGMTTAAGSQSIQVPGMSLILHTAANFVASSALTTATVVVANVSSVAGEVIVTKSTFTAGIPIRVITRGR